MKSHPVTPNSCKDFTRVINICASYLLPDGESNMAVMDIHMVSGYYPDKESLAELENDIALGKFNVHHIPSYYV